MFVTNLLLSPQWLDGGEAEGEDVAEEEEEDGVDQGDDPKALKLHLTIHCLYRIFFFFPICSKETVCEFQCVFHYFVH